MTDLTRRDFSKATAATAAIAFVGVPATIQRVDATESGFPELTAETEIGDGEIDATIDVYVDPDDEDPIESQTLSLEDGTQTYVYDDLESEGDDYYPDVTFDFGSDRMAAVDWFELEFPRSPEDFDLEDHTDDDWQNKDDETEIYFDHYRLRQYAPKLRLTANVRPRFKGLYGYVAEHPDEDTFVCCYWSHLESATTPWGLSDASALGDHKPVYVFVDHESGEVDRVIYAGWHLLAAEATEWETDFVTGRNPDERHIVLEIDDPHHYYRDRDGDESGAEFVEIESLPDERETWLANGFDGTVDPVTVEHPWVFLSSRSSWLRSRSDSYVAGTLRRAGRAGVRDADALGLEHPVESDDSGWFPFSFDWLFGGDDDGENDDADNETDTE